MKKRLHVGLLIVASAAALVAMSEEEKTENQEAKEEPVEVTKTQDSADTTEIKPATEQPEFDADTATTKSESLKSEIKDVFIPDESISEDYAIPFPTDI